MNTGIQQSAGMNTNVTIREIAIDKLVIDPLFAGMFIQERDTIKRISRSIRANGYDPSHPIAVWKDGAGRGRHIVLEGHQQIEAAKAAGLTTVLAAFRHPADQTEALPWTAEEQTNRRNASREALCLNVLRALKLQDQLDGTRAELAERFGFGDATVGRALQVLERGTESEIVAVREGKHGLKTAYEAIRTRTIVSCVRNLLRSRRPTGFGLGNVIRSYLTQ